MTQRNEEQILLEKMMLTDLLDAGLPHNFNFLKNTIFSKHNKIKNNKMRYTYIKDFGIILRISGSHLKISGGEIHDLILVLEMSFWF